MMSVTMIRNDEVLSTPQLGELIFPQIGLLKINSFWLTKNRGPRMLGNAFNFKSLGEVWEGF